MFKKILSVRTFDTATDFGLLVLRIGVFLPLFIKHGWEKIYPPLFSRLAPTFPDPAHIGHLPSLLVASVSDSICAVLLVLGLFARPAAA